MGLLAAWLGLAGACRSVPVVEGWAGLPTLESLDGTPTRWEPEPEDRFVAFVFVGIECPISNRCQPELGALGKELGPRGVRFIQVYPFPDENAERIRAHRAEYGITAAACRDPRHVLASVLGAHRTPEVVVLARDGRKIYQGRVNDQYPALGVAKPEPTRHDLAEALRDHLAGGSAAAKTSPAVGCSFRSAP